MRKITENELKEILEKHQKYLNGEEGGEWMLPASYVVLTLDHLSFIIPTLVFFFPSQYTGITK